MRVLVLVLMLGLLLPGCRFEPAFLTPDDGDATPRPDAASPADAMPPAPWWNDDFEYRVRLTIADPRTDEALRDVPVLVVLEDRRVAYDRVRANGEDLRFIDETGNEMPYEIEHWDTEDRSYVWVRVPVIASGRATHFWLYHGNPDAESNTDAAAVWSNEYLAVWHLAEAADDEGTGAMHEDSTERGNQGTQNGNRGVGPETGAIGGAQDFDGEDDFIEIPQDGLQETGTAVTILVRVYMDAQSVDFALAVGTGIDGDGQWHVARELLSEVWGGRIDAGGDTAIVGGNEGTPVQTWLLVAVVYDGAETLVYLDGEEATGVIFGGATGNLDPLVTPLYIGANRSDQDTELDGIIDEVRLARAARSPSWLRVQHASMSDTLLDFGPAECRDGCP